MAYQERPDTSEYADFYRRYVERVPEGDIIALLATQGEDTLALLRDLSDTQALHAYAPGKWSVKEVIGHLCDAERVFSYRAMRIARGDATPLPSFDENSYVTAGAFNQRPLASLLAEFAAVRRATVALLAGLAADAWTRTGNASGLPVTTRGCAWITAGHELHHRAILAERYLATMPAPGARL